MSATKPDVIVLRGAPGVGKSTTARQLRRLLTAGATVEVDVVRGAFHAVDWSDRSQHIEAIDAALVLLDAFLTAGRRPVVLVDTFGRRALSHLMATLTRSHCIVSLYTDPAELTARLENRPPNEFRDVALSLTLNEEVLAIRHERERLVATSGRPAEDVAREVCVFWEGDEP